MAELLRYSPLAVHDFDSFDQAMALVPEEEGLFCQKCRLMKPLRAHHCSVCDRCTMEMDHHCMWTNNCIGMNNYKSFIQLTGYAILACWFTIAVTYYADDSEHSLIFDEESSRSVVDMTVKEAVFHSWASVLGFAKMWDLLVSKAMLAMFIWNLNVASTGLTFLEYKNWTHRNA
jgi:palmitoyltransferase